MHYMWSLTVFPVALRTHTTTTYPCTLLACQIPTLPDTVLTPFQPLIRKRCDHDRLT